MAWPRIGKASPCCAACSSICFQAIAGRLATVGSAWKLDSCSVTAIALARRGTTRPFKQRALAWITNTWPARQLLAGVMGLGPRSLGAGGVHQDVGVVRLDRTEGVVQRGT